jgi:hypothetical protein
MDSFNQKTTRGHVFQHAPGRRLKRVNDDESTGSLAFLVLIAPALLSLAFLWRS